MEVAVRNGERIACSVHEVRQDSRVKATADSKQHLLPRGEEVLPGDVCYESV